MATNANLAKTDDVTGSEHATADGQVKEQEKVLPLPGWLVKVYFIFPIILYIPDVIFNYYVYSDGATTQDPNPLVQASYVALWGFLSVGVVGMAYLLSVLGPWHWSQGHRVQAFFCAIGVVIATGITTWNSLSYRSVKFHAFATDSWAYSIWPGLANSNISLTMILVAIAPPFWGLFWAVVQPTQSRRSLKHLQESHNERLMRLQQEAEVKRLRAETNATIREAQLRGMAKTAGAAREQMTAALGRNRNTHESDGPQTDTGSTPAVKIEEHKPATTEPPAIAASNVVQMPTFAPNRARELSAGRGAAMMNSAAPAIQATHGAPSNGARATTAQPPLMTDADVRGAAGVPSSDSASWGARRLQSQGFSADVAEPEGMTGTTGPRPAVRRAADPSPLLRAMNEPAPAYVQAVTEAMHELNPTGAKKNVAAKDLTARVAQKLNVDETAAKAIITRVRDAQRASARS